MIKLKVKIIFALVIIILVYYIYFGLIKCYHNFWTDWIGEIVGISCYP